MPPQRYTNFAVDSFNLKGGGIPLHTQAGAEKVRSFHIQALNPFRMIQSFAQISVFCTHHLTVKNHTSLMLLSYNVSPI
jgi:hypothetical protein